jgi:octaheme c-type cytochrome (tetrathionate reductase family)
MINSFCTTVGGGPNGEALEACGKCHAGYGMTRLDFDFRNPEKVDCLVCHAQGGNYARAAIGCTVDMKAMEKGTLNLEKAAQSVAKPTLKNCGYCHFFGGGADGVKHAGLDSTLLKAPRSQDVHMASKELGGAGLACQDCHVTKQHRIAGDSSQMAHSDGPVGCSDCHAGAKAPHQKSSKGAILARHAASVACQSCHIPVFNKGQATKMVWNWSDVGKDIEPNEQFGRETFDEKKGTFVWGKDVAPKYAWYSGKIERYMIGDKIKDPTKPVALSRPVGSISDRNSRIYPYKHYLGDQPMDAVFKYLNVFRQYNSLWKDFDWVRALKAGGENSGLPYSGKHVFVKTEAFIAASHEVSPKEKALQCSDCHGGNRLDWKALGYAGDPRVSGGRFTARRPGRPLAAAGKPGVNP